MGVSDTYTRGRRVLVERPMLAVIAVIGVLLLLDLLRRLAVGILPVSQLISYLLDGLVVGLVVGLAGVGLSMTYSILNFANFAHGDYLTVGGFAGWTATSVVAWAFAGAGATFETAFLLNTSQLTLTVATTPLAVVCGMVVAAVLTVVLALVIDRLVYRPMRGQDAIPLLIASIGIALALRYLVVFVYGTSNRGLTALSQVPSWSIYVLDGTVTLTAHEATLIVAALVLMAGVHLLLQYTKLGTAMRAMADNESLARVTGIPTERIVRATWVIGGGLAGIAGYLIVLERGTIIFNLGWVLLLLIFAAVILGGIGSVYGAMAGGVVIGLTTTLSLIWIPSGFTKAAAFGVMILVLLFRPEGLFSGVTTA
jgi:branched-chain amino acid transport system permease protein